MHSANTNWISFYAVFLFAFIFVPHVAYGAVEISEVAWMGSVASSNDEWIELRNTGTNAVDLSGYTLSSGNGSVHVTISGSISGLGYFLLERTDDSTVPTVAADQIYVGSLTNAGDSLTLKNASGGVIDVIQGGENWGNIGGDNVTKDTAQRTSSGWVTAPGTPRRANASSGSLPTPQPQPTQQSGSASSNREAYSNVSSSAPIDPGMTVSAGGDRSVLIGTDVSFETTAYGKEKKPIPNANYTWTFGDGTSKEGTHVLHQYSIPGDYAVMVSVGNIDSKTMVTDRIVVHAREAAFALMPNSDGSLTLINQGSDDIDIGAFVVKGADTQFILPLHTIILGEGFIRFMPSLLGFSGDKSSVFLYPSGAVAVTSNQSEEQPRNQMPAGMVSGKIEDLDSGGSIAQRDSPKPESIPVQKIPSKKSTVVSSVTDSNSELAAVQGVLSDSTESSPLALWLLLLSALLGSAIAAVILIRRQPIEATLTADDFTITEETEPFL